jgi:hypothetical protein
MMGIGQPFDPDHLHEECASSKCRPSIMLQYIDQYPEALAIADNDGNLPLHTLLTNWSASACTGTDSMDIALLIMDKYPAAVAPT